MTARRTTTLNAETGEIEVRRGGRPKIGPMLTVRVDDARYGALRDFCDRQGGLKLAEGARLLIDHIPAVEAAMEKRR